MYDCRSQTALFLGSIVDECLRGHPENPLEIPAVSACRVLILFLPVFILFLPVFKLPGGRVAGLRSRYLFS